MTYEISKTTTPVDVSRTIAQAQALRSAYIAALVSKASRKFAGLFNRAPRSGVTA